MFPCFSLTKYNAVNPWSMRSINLRTGSSLSTNCSISLSSTSFQSVSHPFRFHLFAASGHWCGGLFGRSGGNASCMRYAGGVSFTFFFDISSFPLRISARIMSCCSSVLLTFLSFETFKSSSLPSMVSIVFAWVFQLLPMTIQSIGVFDQFFSLRTSTVRTFASSLYFPSVNSWMAPLLTLILCSVTASYDINFKSCS